MSPTNTATPRIVNVRDKNNKLTWPETHDYEIVRHRFKSDHIPAPLMIARYFEAERKAIESLEAEVAVTEQKLDELREEQVGEDGLLAEANEANEGEEPRITTRSIRAALMKLEDDVDSADEVKAL